VFELDDASFAQEDVSLHIEHNPDHNKEVNNNFLVHARRDQKVHNYRY